MNKEFAPYDIALSVKGLGYREECFGFYDDILNENETEHRLFPIRTQTLTDRMLESLTPAPIYQQLFRWLLEEVVDKEDYMITRNGGNPDTWDGQVYGKSSRTGRAGWQYESQGVSYTEAQDACLRKLIEIVKEKRDD